MSTTLMWRNRGLARDEDVTRSTKTKKGHAKAPVVAGSETTTPDARHAIEALVNRVCARIAPSFPLDDLVAVNPFVGFVDTPFFRAHGVFERRLHADVLPTVSVFRRMFDAGRFDEGDVRQAITEWNETDADHYRAPWLDPRLALQLLDGTLGDAAFASASPGPRVLSIAGRLDHEHGLDLRSAIVSDIAALLASQQDRGIAKLRTPTGGQRLFSAFLAFARRDRSMKARGIDGLPELARTLPADPYVAIESLLAEIPLPETTAEDYLGRLLWEVQGWAGALRAMAFRTAHDALGELPDLLAIRLSYDAMLRNARSLQKYGALAPCLVGGRGEAIRYDVALRYVLLRAAERGVRRRIVSQFAPPLTHEPGRADVQAVFCIDVRSEPLRRMLEKASPRVETYGFAGFFGLPIAVHSPESPDGRAQCPVLLTPGHHVGLESGDPASTPAGKTASLLGEVRKGPFASFEYVETFGFASLLPLLGRSFGLEGSTACTDEHAPVNRAALALETRIALAAGILKNLGLRRPYARILLLCGHDARSANNPQAASLACGACAGHGGSVNARLGAALLNDPEVRDGLRAHGFELPADLVVVAAVHETTTDEVRILDRDAIPSEHADDLARLEGWLARSGEAVRSRRARDLVGVADAAKSSARSLFRALRRRSRDWSEVRPEWALANNVAFIAARRERTADADLDGRAFLHSYDRRLDPDGSVLELILTAPVVVASWINLQYFGSTVAPEHLGSGLKTLHNVSAGVGVVQGNGGDLAVGLSVQSVHDGERARHEPLRLQVFVEDDEARIDAVLQKHPTLAALVHHEYIVLHALDYHSERCTRFLPGAGWVPVERTDATIQRSKTMSIRSPIVQ